MAVANRCQWNGIEPVRSGALLPSSWSLYREITGQLATARCVGYYVPHTSVGIKAKDKPFP